MVRTETPVAESPGESTRTALLDTAERLFAREGIDRASLRAITRGANANLASVHYHFGSKVELVRAVLARRLGPLNEERLGLLAEAEREPERASAVEPIVRAFVAPVLRMASREQGGPDFARLVVRAITDPGPEIRGLVFAQFREVIERFTAALARALPNLGDEEVYWRFFFMVGSMAHTAGMGAAVHRLSGGLCDAHDSDAVIERLVRFAAAGLRQPGPPSPESAS